MNILILAASAFGNTATLAKAMAVKLAETQTVSSTTVVRFAAEQLAGIDLFIVGSPTQRFYPLPAISKILRSLPGKGLLGVDVAAFDTRSTEAEIGKARVREFFVGIFGYAAPSIAKLLKRKGGTMVAAPEGFYVGGILEPLLPDELERARNWAAALVIPAILPALT